MARAGYRRDRSKWLLFHTSFNIGLERADAAPGARAQRRLTPVAHQDTAILRGCALRMHQPPVSARQKPSASCHEGQALVCIPRYRELAGPQVLEARPLRHRATFRTTRVCMAPNARCRMLGVECWLPRNRPRCSRAALPSRNAALVGGGASSHHRRRTRGELPWSKNACNGADGQRWKMHESSTAHVALGDIAPARSSDSSGFVGAGPPERRRVTGNSLLFQLLDLFSS